MSLKNINKIITHHTSHITHHTSHITLSDNVVIIVMFLSVLVAKICYLLHT